MSTATMISQDEFLDSHSNERCPALKILLAEHHQKLRRLICFALRFDGHDVQETAGGGEMLEVMAGTIMDHDTRQFDLIIAAHDLPSITGFAVLAGLRSHHCATPFILMTEDPVVQARARRLGAVILDRPSNTKAVRSAVVEAYSLRGAAVIELP